MTALRAAARGALLALALWPAAPRAQAPAPAEAPAPGVGAAPAAGPSLPERLSGVPGTWDLSRDGTNRRCVMTLTGDSGEAGRKLFFPAGCRRALPVVAGIAGWLFADEAVRLVDHNVRPVLLFAKRPDHRSYVARTEGGETYSLVPLDIVGMRPAEPLQAEAPALRSTEPPALRAPAPVPAELVPPPGAPAPAPLPAALPAAEPAPEPGTYALDRFKERDTCRLALAAGGAVRVAAGCRDSGLEVFDPVRWTAASGRMTLTAKRGHTIDLVPSGDGRWRRDPEVGTTFVLRRVGS